MEFDSLSSRLIDRAFVHRDEVQRLTHMKMAGVKIGVENFNDTKKLALPANAATPYWKSPTL